MFKDERCISVTFEFLNSDNSSVYKGKCYCVNKDDTEVTTKDWRNLYKLDEAYKIKYTHTAWFCRNK